MKSTVIENKMQTFMALILVSLLLITAITTTGCNSGNIQNWLNLASQDLPILEKEATNIIAISDPADLALAQRVSAGVSSGLTLVSDAVNAYKANPNATTLQAVAAALDRAAIDLPALLSGINFSDPTVGLAITAAVAAIVGTLDIVASQLPASTQTKAMRMARAGRTSLTLNRKEAESALTSDSLRARWNAKVCDAYQKLTQCPRM